MEPYFTTEDGRVVLYHGDCAEVLPQLDLAKAFPSHADVNRFCVITDPPYSKHTHEKQRHGVGTAPPLVERGRTKRASISRAADLGFAHLRPSLRKACAAQFARLAGSWVLVFSDAESTHRWRRDLVAAGLRYVRTGYWVKLGSTPQFTGDRPAVGAEPITICHRDLNKGEGRMQWNGGGRVGVWTHAIVQNRTGRKGGIQRGGEARWGTAQKPEHLMSELVRDFTFPNDVVLDPFAGTGTTLVAARNHGRRAVGIEVSEDECKKVVARLSQCVLSFASASLPGGT